MKKLYADGQLDSLRPLTNHSPRLTKAVFGPSARQLYAALATKARSPRLRLVGAGVIQLEGQQ